MVLGERVDLPGDFAQVLLAAFAASVVVDSGHKDATGGKVIVGTGEIGDHEIALRIGENEDEVEETVHLALDTMPGCLEQVGLGLPSLLADEAAFKMLQGGMFLGTQEKHSPLGADVGIDIQGVNEGVDRVGHSRLKKFVVFVVGAYPEPDQAHFGLLGKRTIVVSHTGGPELADFFQTH